MPPPANDPLAPAAGDRSRVGGWPPATVGAVLLLLAVPTAASIRLILRHDCAEPIAPAKEYHAQTA